MKKYNSLVISFPDPCTADWSSMTPVTASCNLFSAALITSLLTLTLPGMGYAQKAAAPQSITVKNKHAGKFPHFLEGEVMDAATGAPLRGVTVLLNNLHLPVGETPDGTITDSQGKFRISLHHQFYGAALVLHLSYLGYASDTITIDAESARAPVQVCMEPSESELKEVVITGYAPIVDRTFAGNTSLISNTTLNAKKHHSFWWRLTHLFRR